MKCGKPVEEEEEYCLDCQGKDTSFLYGRALFRYNQPMRGSMARFKYHGRQEYAPFYAKELYKQFGKWLIQLAPDALIPVPIHDKRRRKRGYNQAELVAEELGKLCRIEVIKDYLVRSKNTKPQKGLSDRERIANLQAAFSVGSVAQELYNKLKCVIIIDDIYTTGSTVEACSRVLREQGVERVYFLCICIGQGF